MRITVTVGLVLSALVAVPAASADAQGMDTLPTLLAATHQPLTVRDSSGASGGDDVDLPVRYRFASDVDSAQWAHARALANRSTGLRIVVSLQDRHLWAIVGDDTALSTVVAVAKGTTLDFAGKEWTFKTPRGVRTVLDKQADPVWQPPDWLYAETAAEYGLLLSHMPDRGTVTLSDGRRLAVRDNAVGVIDTTGEFAALPLDEHIVFDGTLFIPPLGTANRKINGELGKYRLDLGDGYLLHGTPYKDSIGMAATHGCIRLGDDDIQWLFDHVPVGTRVYIY